MKSTVKHQLKQSTTKGVILAVFVAAASITSQAAVASLPFANLPSSGGPAILTVTVITPGGVELPLDSVNFCVGMSKNNPCSDLVCDKSVGQSYVRNGTGYTTSDDFINLEAKMVSPYNHPGSLTCFRFNTVYKGKPYSTGNIQLTWDGKQYTKANPAAITLDYTK